MTQKQRKPYRFAPDKSLAEAKALMIGADAGAKLGNGEIGRAHV